jgi:HEPN domain-containing protein
MSPEHVGEWLRKAEADRRTAQFCLALSRKEEDQAEIACFHTQQCIEKYLKAILANIGKNPPKIHDLEALAELVSAAAKVTLPLDDLELLNAYAVNIRYPGATATPAEARQAVAAMNRVRRSCRAALKPGRNAPRRGAAGR